MPEELSYKAPSVAVFIDKVVLKIGNLFSLMNLLLLAVIVIQVVLRYFFNAGVVALEELQWQMYGSMLITSMSYALVNDAHVRLDLFSSGYSARTRELVEIFGIAFILLPLLAVLLIHGYTFFENSFMIHERSDAPTGLPMLWLFKALLPAGILLYTLAAVSRLIKGIAKVASGTLEK